MLKKFNRYLINVDTKIINLLGSCLMLFCYSCGTNDPSLLPTSSLSSSSVSHNTSAIYADASIKTRMNPYDFDKSLQSDTQATYQLPETELIAFAIESES